MWLFLGCGTRGMVGRENFFSFHALDSLNFIKITVCIAFIIKKKMIGIFLACTWDKERKPVL